MPVRGTRQLDHAENGVDLRSRDPWKVIKEELDRPPRPEIVEEMLHGNSRAEEARCAAHARGVDPDDAEERIARKHEIAFEVFLGDAGCRVFVVHVAADR